MIFQIKWLRTGCIALAVFCVIGDFLLFRTAFFDADYVQSFNELAAIHHGNIFLHSFSVAVDSFYLTDLPFYVAFSWFSGASPTLIYIVPYTIFLLFLTACTLLVWRAGANPAQRFGGVLAVMVVFGIPYGWPQSIFLVSDEHGAGLMYSVFALLIAQTLLKLAVPNRFLLALFCFIVLIVAASDQMINAYFVLPYFVLFVLRVWVYRQTSGTEILLFGYLLFAALLGAILPALISRHGGFDLSQSFSLQFVPFIPSIFANAKIVLVDLAFLFDAKQAALAGVAGASVIAVSRAAMCLAAIALCGRAIWRLPVRPADVITQWLVVGAVTLSAMEISSQFFALNSTCDAGGPPVCAIRYVAPVFVYLVLAGILEGQRYIADLTPSRLRKALGVAFAAAAVLFLAGGAVRFWQVAGQPEFAQNTQQRVLTDWLAARKLSYGISDYWTSQLVTAFSGGAVKTDTVVVFDRIQPDNWIGDMADLRAGRRPQFVVFGTGNDGFRGVGTRPLDLANIVEAYGPPVAVEAVGDYQVAVLRKADQ